MRRIFARRPDFKIDRPKVSRMTPAVNLHRYPLFGGANCWRVLPAYDEQHLLSSPPVSCADHPAHRVAIFPLRSQLSRYRRFDGGAGRRRQLRDRLSLGDQVRRRLRTPAEKEAAEIGRPMASRRGLRFDPQSADVSLACRRLVTPASAHRQRRWSGQ